MNKLLIVFFLLFFSTHGRTQLSEKQGLVSFKYSMGTVDSARYSAYSASGEWRLKENFGLNYNLEFIHRNDHIYQIHSSAGTIVGPPIFLFGLISLISNNAINNSDFSVGSFGVLLGILAFIVPDGVSFHIPYKYNWDFSPYANILGVDYMKNNNNNKSYFRYSSSFGIRVNYWQESNLTLSSFIETRKVAAMGWAFGGGIGIGYAFSDR